MNILYYPHPLLTRELKPVHKIDQDFRDTVREMFTLMYESNGVGLAANQVGLPFKFFVMNPTADPEKTEEEFVFINPVIKKRFGALALTEEGCLSFPDIHIDVPRPEGVEFQAINLKGELVRYKWKGFKARIVQHETDHLIGVSFFQRGNLAGNSEARDGLESLVLAYKKLLEEHPSSLPTEEEVDEILAQLPS